MNTPRTNDRHSRRRHLQGLLAACGIGMLPACATILHPERKGNYKGPLDVGALVLDILWFIPGLVPGIIALAVDFSSGAIYVGGGRAAAPTPAGDPEYAVGPGERMTVRRPEPKGELTADLELTLRLCSPQGKVLDQSTGLWTPDGGDALGVSFGDARREHQGAGYLELSLTGQSGFSRHPLLLSRDPSSVVG